MNDNSDHNSTAVDKSAIMISNSMSSNFQNSTNFIQMSNQTSFYPYQSAVEAFKNQNMKKTMFYLYKFSQITLYDFFSFSPEFDKSYFSDYLIRFVDSSTCLEVLYVALDIIGNLTHYETELRYLLSLIQRNLYGNLNQLFQNPINSVVSSKGFIILKNISLASLENRNELLSKINFSFLLNPQLNSFYPMNEIFELFPKFLNFHVTSEIFTFICNTIFPYLYNRSKENDLSNYKSFILLLYKIEKYFNQEFFEKYLLKYEVFKDLFFYFSNFLKNDQEITSLILGIFSHFIPMRPQIFMSLVPSILKFVSSLSSLNKNLLDSDLINGYSIIMRQLFVRFNKLFKNDELQQIVISLLKLEHNLPFTLRRQILSITSNSIALFPPTFTHSNLELLYNVCNDWIASEINELLLGTIFLVIRIQMNEDSLAEPSYFLDSFVRENIDILNQILEENKSDLQLRSFVFDIFKCYANRNQNDLSMF